MGRRTGRKKGKAARRNRNSLPDSAQGLDSAQDVPGFLWQESDGLHALVPGMPPDQLTLELMTRAYQERIRKSPLWDEMVREFGLPKAEVSLKQCRAQLR